MSKPTLSDLGVCPDEVIIEIKGGVLQEVHNTPNGYILYDWDVIEDEDEENAGKKKIELHNILNALDDL